MKKLILVGMLVMTGCSSVQRVEHVNTVLDVKGQIGSETIGLDKDQQAIVQEKQLLEDKLRTQRWQNADLEQLLNSDHFQLVHCQKDLANPLLDGNGDMPNTPDVDAAVDLSKTKSELGLDENGSLVFVTKELVKDRIAREEKYHTNLMSNHAIVKKHLETCLFKMGIARQKKGLSPSWYFRDEAKGYEYEDNLSIAFKNAAKNK